MTDSLYSIFGDHIMKQAAKNVPRQPLHNIENMGKTVTTGPFKPNEPVKKIVEPLKKLGEPKKSFLSNTGKALQSTPARKVFTPRAINVGTLIYSDTEGNNDKSVNFEELEFTKPTHNFDDYHRDILDYLPLPELGGFKDESPPNTPPPAMCIRPTMEFDCSYEDDFFTDDFSNDMIPDNDLDLPNLY